MKNVFVTVLLMGTLAACGELPTLDQEFQGPGWDKDKKALKDATPRRLIAAATHLIVKQSDPRTHPTFAKVMRPISKQLETMPGLVGYGTRVYVDLSED